MEGTESTLQKRFIIVDVDCGFDDAWALFMLLRAERETPDKLKILAITCVTGNTHIDNVLINVLRILNAAGRCDIPVFRGACDPLMPRNPTEFDYFHGHDGFADVHTTPVPDSMWRSVSDEMAVNAMNRIVNAHPGQVTVVGLGPLTNIALAVKMFRTFKHTVRDVWIMGGNYRGIGNVTPHAEFNFYSDPEAAFIVLDTLRCPVTILPWEPCMQPDFFIPWQWRRNEIAPMRSPALDLLNPIEMKIYDGKIDHWVPCDALLVAALIEPATILDSQQSTVTVDYSVDASRGRMNVHNDAGGLSPEQVAHKATVTIVTRISVERFKQLIKWTLTQ